MTRDPHDGLHNDLRIDPATVPANPPADELRRQRRAVRPRDAATLIVVRRDGAEPRLLMGKRSAAHRFMPNKFVFPGGRVDPGDGRLRPPLDLHPDVLRRLSRGCTPVRARALALAAIRETFEETGLILGEPHSPTLHSRSPHWAAFLRYDANPRLDVLHYVARAITPPQRGLRFDARFFMIDAEHIQGDVHERPTGSGELLNLHWVPVSQAAQLSDLPKITRMVLGEIEQRLHGEQVPDTEGPFFYTRHGRTVVDRE